MTNWELCYDSTIDDEDMKQIYDKYDSKQKEDNQGGVDDFDPELLKDEVED